MTTVRKLLLLQFFLFQAISSYGQFENDYKTHEYLVHFEDNVAESYIDSLRESYNSIEIWQSPLSEIRLWKVQYFPFTPPGQNYDIIDINGVVPPVKTKSGVDGSQYNLALNLEQDWLPVMPLNSQYITCASNYSVFIPTGQSNIKISILDSGYSPQELKQGDYFLPQNVSSGYDYVDDDEDYADANGHGTHIAGIIAHTSQFVSGPNTNIEFDIRRTHNSAGQGHLSSIILGMDEAILAGSNIINMSFSFQGDSAQEYKIFEQAMNTAKAHNTLVVSSAGNNSSDNDTGQYAAYPASFDHDHIISVASVNCDFQLSPFSNFGAKSVDIGVPGELIAGPGLSSQLVANSGTSQAAAVISGLSVALATHLGTFDYSKIKCSIEMNAETSPALTRLIKSSGVIDAQSSLDNLHNSACLSSQERFYEEDQASQRTVISPNPFYSGIMINSESEFSRLNIYTTAGKLTRSITMDKTRSYAADIGDLPLGTYFIQIFTMDGIENLKAIKY